MPNEEFYSSATIARPTAEPKETNPEEPPAQVAASKEASNETQGKSKNYLRVVWYSIVVVDTNLLYRMEWG